VRFTFAHGPKPTLKRGFTIVRADDQTVLGSKAKAQPVDTVNVIFSDGKLRYRRIIDGGE
jgi:exonuclease VII large subunit